jgi:hypothetical protein
MSRVPMPLCGRCPMTVNSAGQGCRDVLSLAVVIRRSLPFAAVLCRSLP